MEKIVRKEWEERALQYPSNIRGVLFRRLPDEVNTALNDWHKSLVESFFLPYLPHGSNVIDIASGFGRLSNFIQFKRKDILLFGLDFSFNYCSMYYNHNRYVICGDISNLPFKENQWDGILIVTGLMYINSDECGLAVDGIVSSLKPGGVAIFIDPGAEFIKLIRKLEAIFLTSSKGAEGFLKKEYLDLFRNQKCSIIKSGGNGFFTLLAPLFVVLRRFPKILKMIMNIAVWLDSHLSWDMRFSIHRWVLLRNET